jgi:hypothetical protein
MFQESIQKTIHLCNLHFRKTHPVGYGLYDLGSIPAGQRLLATMFRLELGTIHPRVQRGLCSVTGDKEAGA